MVSIAALAKLERVTAQPKFCDFRQCVHNAELASFDPACPHPSMSAFAGHMLSLVVGTVLHCCWAKPFVFGRMTGPPVAC